MRIGVLCPSEIALRRFMPALKRVEGIEYAGIAVCDEQEFYVGENERNEISVQDILNSEKNKAEVFREQFGGKIYSGYRNLINSEDIDAIYIPLPPGLHYNWAKAALECGKHVLVEKPCTISLNDTEDLIETARKSNLALHENYMFTFHSQLEDIYSMIRRGDVGDIRLYRIRFGFPKRAKEDFRYKKDLGGGALIDAGGYTIKFAYELLGDSIELQYSQMNYLEEYDVDMYGSAAYVNADGVAVHVAYGMDNQYKCELEVWGSKGSIITNRVLTAPVGYTPKAQLNQGSEMTEVVLSEDDAFKKSIEYFIKCVNNSDVRETAYKKIFKQSEMMDEYRKNARVYGRIS